MIERSRQSIYRFDRIRFTHNQQFLYLPEHYKQGPYWEGLIRAFKITNSVYGLALQSLIARGAMIPLPYFDIVSGSPERLSKHISSSTVLKQLVGIGLFEIVEHSDLGACVKITDGALPELTLPKPSMLRASVIAEEIILSGLKEWIRNTGLGSANSIHTRNLRKQPKFGQFKWDLSAPSYLQPLRRLTKERKPLAGFVVADVLLGRDVEPADVEYFFRKTDTMNRQPSAFVAMLIANRFREDALRAGRNKGLLFVTTETLFGREVAEGITQLIQVLSNAAAAISSDPTLVSQLFLKLDALKGASLNLKGPLFELLQAHLMRVHGWNLLSIGDLRRDPISKRVAEIDILAIKGTQVVACECKGYVGNAVEEEEVEKWLQTKVPTIRASMEFDRFYQTKEVIFQFRTTSTFSSEALAYLKNKKSEIKKFQFDWEDGSGVLAYAKNLEDNYAMKILREQYNLS